MLQRIFYLRDIREFIERGALFFYKKCHWFKYHRLSDVEVGTWPCSSSTVVDRPWAFNARILYRSLSKKNIRGRRNSYGTFLKEKVLENIHTNAPYEIRKTKILPPGNGFTFFPIKVPKGFFLQNLYRTHSTIFVPGEEFLNKFPLVKIAFERAPQEQVFS